MMGTEEESGMKLRIAIWAGAGALVVLFWSLYISAISTTPHGIARVLMYLTCPISLGGRYPLNFYLVLLVNAGTYALAGAAVEAMRRRHKNPNVA
jgi:hypothetical protein